MTLTNRILLGMALGLVVGVMLNLLVGGADEPVPATVLSTWLQVYVIDGVFDAVGQIFIASLKLLVVPLVFVSLVCGAASLGGQSRMGALATKTLGLYFCCTSFAVALSITCAVLIQPGADVDIPTATSFTAPEIPSIKDTLINIVPSNPLQSMVEANMLQIIIFSILFGLAISRTGGEAAANMIGFFNNLNDVILRMVMMLMQLAPYGVFCLIAKLFASLGWASFSIWRSIFLPWYWCCCYTVLVFTVS